MSTLTSDFFHYVGQTSPFPIQLEIDHANGVYFIDMKGEKYVDFTSGIAVSNVGHGNQQVIKAIQSQAEKHLHTMVFGEFVETPQVQYAKKLTEQLPKQLNCLYYCTSGSEAVEAAMKLAKRKTQRTQLISFQGSYHGSTHGPLSLMGAERYKTAYRPLLPDTKQLRFNELDDLEEITEQTAAVITEVVQAASGVTVATKEWLQALRARCNEVGAMLIFDEVQTGFGRTGKLFAFEHDKVIPDVLLIAKAMGGGVPIGGLVSKQEWLKLFTHKPILGHINTFGGNALACAAAHATLQQLLQHPEWMQTAPSKAKMIDDALSGHEAVEKITYKGLLMAMHFKTKQQAHQFMQEALQRKVVLIGFLLNEQTVRLAPPLTITHEELKDAIERLRASLDAM